MSVLSLHHVQRVCTTLLLEKNFHRSMAGFYMGLFNDFETDETPETIAAIGYPPLREFYQQQAQYHQCRVLRMEEKIKRFEAIADRNTLAL